MEQKVRDRLLNVEQVRVQLGCSRSHVYRLIGQRNLLAIKIGTRMGIRIKESDVKRFMDKNIVEV